MGKATRNCYFDGQANKFKDVPGPGNYRIQNEFGMYNPNDVLGWTQQRFFETGRKNRQLEYHIS